MKLTSKRLKSIDTLTQDQRLHTKEFFNLWSENSSLPNANKHTKEGEEKTPKNPSLYTMKKKVIHRLYFREA